MEQRHRDTLIQSRCVIIDQLVTETGLWDHLLNREVFSKNMLDRIKVKQTPLERRQELLDNLPRRGPQAFGKFLSILRDTNQRDLANYLEAVERHVATGSIGSPPSPPRPRPLPPPLPPPPQTVNTTTVFSGPERIDQELIPVQKVLEQNIDELPREYETEGYIDRQQLMPQPVSTDFVSTLEGNNWDGVYRVTSDPKGLLLIISNKNFSEGLSERSGTEVDCENLTRLFTNLRYELYDGKVFTNQSAQEMRDLCKRFILDQRHNDLDSCILCILSHGDSGGVIYGTDNGKVTYDELFLYFNNKKCCLHGKPKLVIIQACKGSMKDRGTFDQPDSGSGDQNSRRTIVQNIICDLQKENYDEIMELDGRVPTYADIVFAHSTTPGFVSWRHALRGSWFIQAIVKTFAANAHKEHVMDMLITVNRVVVESFGANLKSVMMPNPVARLQKKFFFFPK